MTDQLLQKRYHALLSVFGLSVVLSLSWGFCRWVWLMSGMSWGVGDILATYLMPIFLTGLQLYLCRHHIRAIDDSIEKYVWWCLPFMSLLLFYSAGLYVEMRFSPHGGNANAGTMMAQAWQIVLLAEALLLFIVYRKYYVASAMGSTSADIFSLRNLSGVLVFLVVPFAMVCMYVVASTSDDFDKHAVMVLIQYGSAHYRLVLERDEWWRLFTYAFLHSGSMHLKSNLLCYFCCAAFIYKRHNGFQAFAVFMFSSFVSGLFIVLFSNYNCVGASGGVFGLTAFWALDTLSNLRDRKVKIVVIVNNLLTAATVIFYFLLDSFDMGVSPSGYLGGFLAGFSLWFLFRFWPIIAWFVITITVVFSSVSIYAGWGYMMALHRAATAPKNYGQIMDITVIRFQNH